ncbi:MAG TPA: response regulator, partial [Methylobacter sp.]
MAKILIVDDHESNRELMVVLCQHLGHKTLEAADGAEALTLVRIERPQLVVCDILMPTMDGYEFVRQLRADPNIAQTEVIFYTANYREREARSLASAVGVSHIIFKPSEAIDIMQVLEAALTHTPELESLPDTSEFDREHLRLITDKLAEKAHEQEQLNQRLSTLIDLNLKLASERDPH